MFFESHSRLLSLGEYYKTNPRRVTACEFTRIIRRQFPSADFSFRTSRDRVVHPDMVVVSGIYDSYNDDYNLPHIEITLSYYPMQEYYFLHVLDWEQLSFDIAECVGHELVHKQQHLLNKKVRRYRSKALTEAKRVDQEYLGSTDEIEAYGFSIAAESVLNDKPHELCAMYQVYVETFDNDPKVIVQLEKQISKYIKQLERRYEQASCT